MCHFELIVRRKIGSQNLIAQSSCFTDCTCELFSWFLFVFSSLCIYILTFTHVSLNIFSTEPSPKSNSNSIKVMSLAQTHYSKSKSFTQEQHAILKKWSAEQNALKSRLIL